MKNEEPIGDTFAEEIVQRIDEITWRERYAPNRERILGRVIHQLQKLVKGMPPTKRHFDNQRY